MADKYVKLDDVMNAIGGVPKRKESPYPTPIHLAAERIITRLKERITKIPTADVVEVKHGEWLWDIEDIYECSICGIQTKVDEVMGMPIYKFCPSCGAKMDGGINND